MHGAEEVHRHDLAENPQAGFGEGTAVGDAGVVDQHVDGAVFGLGVGEGLHRGVPVAHVADRSVEGVAQRLLFVQPLFIVASGAAARDDLHPFPVQALTNGSANSTHASRDVCDFLTHCVLLFCG